MDGWMDGWIKLRCLVDKLLSTSLQTGLDQFSQAKLRYVPPLLAPCIY